MTPQQYNEPYHRFERILEMLNQHVDLISVSIPTRDIKHKPLPYPQTEESAKKYFRDRGICISHWAKGMGLKRSIVTDVLLGRGKAIRGMRHEAAVALGIKQQLED